MRVIPVSAKSSTRSSRQPGKRLPLVVMPARSTHVVNAIVLNDLMALAANDRASNQVRAIASWKLDQLKSWLTLQRRAAADENHRAFVYYTLEQIKRFQEDPKKVNLTPPQAPPDGQPIGTDDCGCVYLPCLL